MKRQQNRTDISFEETATVSQDDITKEHVPTSKAPNKGDLSAKEKATLTDCEAAIKNGKKAYLEVGEALEKIQTLKLYRTDFPNFNDYCIKRWAFTKQHAHRLITAFRTVDDMEPIGDGLIPQSESVARELVKVPADKRAHAMELAQSKAGDAKPKAKHVKEAAQEMDANREAKQASPSNIIEMPAQPRTTELTPLREVIDWVKEVQDNLREAKDQVGSLKLLSQVVDELEARIRNEAARNAA